MKKRKALPFCVTAFIAIIFIAGFVLDYCAIWQIDLATLIPVSEIVLAGFFAFSAIWFAGYYIQRQVLSNRYPESLFDDLYQPVALCMILDILIVLICGEIALLFFVSWGRAALIVASSASVVYMLVVSYRIGRSIDSTSYVVDIVNKQIEQRKKLKRDGAAPYGVLNDVYCESLTRNELYVCLCVHKELSRLARAHHEISAKMLINGGASSEDLDCDFKEIVKTMNYQVLEIRDDVSPRFVRQILKCHRDNVVDCARLDRFTLFQYYVQELLGLAYALSPSTQNIVRRDCLSVLACCIMECDRLNRPSYWEYCIARVREAAIGSHILAEASMASEWIALYALVFCDDQPLSEELRKSVYDSFLEVSLFEAQIMGNIEKFIKYHILIFRKLLILKSDELNKQYLRFVSRSLRYLRDDPSWINCVQMFAHQLEEKSEICLRKEIDKLRVDISCQVINVGNKNVPISISNYGERLDGGLDDEAVIDDAIESYRDLIFESIQDGEHGATRLLCEDVAELVTGLNSSQRKLQNKLFQLLFECLNWATYSDQRVCFELIVRSIDELVRDLDAKTQLSEGLVKDILKELFSLCDEKGIDDDCEYQGRILSMLSHFYDDGRELAILLRKNELRTYYFDKWLTIGISALEYHNEEAIRQVSNHIGWFIVSSLKKGDQATARNLVKEAERLFLFAEGFEVAANTRIFLLTLFAVVGSFCTTRVEYYSLRDEIASFLSDKDIEDIKLAIDIRFQPGVSWAELFERNPREHAEEFLGMVRSCAG